MPYLTGLSRQRQLPQLTKSDQMILLAQSNEKYLWRTGDRTSEVTGLDVSATEETLAELLRKDLIKPSINKNKRIIYALSERAPLRSAKLSAASGAGWFGG